MNKKRIITIFLVVACIVLFHTTHSAIAAKYELLETMPGVANAEATDVSFAQYATGIYNFAVAAVVISALMMMTIGGFLYMTSAGNQAQAGTAKKIITDALLGLIVVFTIWIVLHTINEDLVNVGGTMGLQAMQGTVSSPNNTPPSNTGVGGECNGIAVSGIKKSQCGDVSPRLGQFLTCLNDAAPGLKITSISDDDATNDLSACQGSSYSHPPCDHSRNSCHYGGSGGGSQSCAVDISTRSANLPQGTTVGSLIDIGNACGAAFTKDESLSSNHLHFSVTGCDCDGHS